MSGFSGVVWAQGSGPYRVNSQNIDQVKETVFLGVIMDENLNWKSEISHVANRKRGRVQRIHVQTVFSF